MPRNVKECDDEMEPKSARRTRAALNSSVLDSPLRRSSRIKPPAQSNDGSSPESLSDTSSSGLTRSTRRRTTTGESGVTEPAKNSRARRNSIASDISELTETESLADGPARRVTRRSVAGLPSAETPTKLNGRTRRATRAGSETKTSPPPARTTRRTRASSLEPEAVDDLKIRESATPVKSRKRASVLPSEPAVAEETEDAGTPGRRAVDSIVYEVEEEIDVSSHNTSNSSRRRSKIDTRKSVEKMEVDEDPVEDTEGNTSDGCIRGVTEREADVSKEPKKLEDSAKVTEPSEATLADEAPLQPSPSKGSSNPTDSPPIAPPDNQENRPGTKDKEILDDSSVALLASTTKTSNPDVRCSIRKSMSAISAKSTEKRHNSSLDERFLSNNYATPKKINEDASALSAPNTNERIKRKERYSVDDCVVLIEPMEIDRIEKSIVTKETSDDTEGLEKQKIRDIVKEEPTENDRIDGKSADKNVDDTIIITIDDDCSIDVDSTIGKDRAIDQTDPTIGKDRTIVPTDSKIGEDRAIDQTDLTIGEDRAIVLTDSPIVEDCAIVVTDSTIDKDRAIVPIGSTIDEDRAIVQTDSTIDEDRAIVQTDSKIDEDCAIVLTDSTIDDDRAIVPTGSTIDEDRAIVPTDSTIDEDRAIVPTDSTIDEDRAIVLTDSTISKPSIANANEFHENTNVESEPMEISVTTEHSDSRKIDTSDATTKQTLGEIANCDTLSSESSISNFVLRTSMSDDKSSFDDFAIADKTSTDVSNTKVDVVDSGDSLKNEKTINSNEVAGNVVFAKDGKSSIVTESPETGTKDEDADVSRGNTDKRKSSTNSRTSNADERADAIGNDDSKNKIVNEPSVAPSDDGSDCDGYPAFKDIPADEWRAEDNRRSNKNTEIETNSVHSASTERNESECDFELVDKYVCQGSEKEDQPRSDYDSDDTVKIAIATRRSKDSKDEEERPESPEMRMELSSNDEEDEDVDKDINSDVSKRRESLNGSKMKNETNTPSSKKNISIIADISVRDSPSNANASRTLDSTKKSGSVTNTPSNADKRANESLVKSNRSGKTLEIDEDEDAEESVLQTSIGKRSKGRSSTGNGRDSLSSGNNTPVIKKIVNDLDRSAKIGSARKSLNEKNSSKIAENDDSEGDDEVEESRKDLSIQMNRSRKSASAKKSKIRRSGMEFAENSDCEIEATQNNGESPDAATDVLEKSVKVGSAKKSANKSYSTVALAGSDSEAEALPENSVSSETIEEVLEKSAKVGSAKKSANKNNSKLLLENSDFDVEATQTDPASPEAVADLSEKSIKIGSAQKSASKNNSIIALDSSDSEVEDCQDESTSPETIQEPLSKSFRIESAEKSANKNISKLLLENSDSDIEAIPNDTADPESVADVLEKSVKSGSAKKNISMSVKYASSDSDANDEKSQRKLDKLAKIGSAKKSAKKIAMMSVTSSESDGDDDDSPKNSNRSSESGSAKKSVMNRNYSTIAQVNSDSEINEEVESDSDDSRKIPNFLFDDDSDDDSSKSIDSDVARELNLDGKSVLEYSDDNVPADDCMATESESSDDDDDDGADLADFVVEDDEDEDEDEEDVSEDVEMEVDVADDDKNVSSSIDKKSPRKRIIPRPSRSSDSEDSDAIEPIDVSRNLDKSTIDKTPLKIANSSKSPKTIEADLKSADLNRSSKSVAAKIKNLSIQSSTPKTLARHSLLVEKSTPSKKATPLSKSLKSANSSSNLESTPLKFDVSSSKKLSKSVCEKIETPTKIVSSANKSAISSSKKLSKSVCEKIETPTKIVSSANKSAISSSKKLSKSVCDKIETPTKIVSSPINLEISSSKKLSKSIRDTNETPTKLVSSFKVAANTPKTPGSVKKQSRKSLTIDPNDSADVGKPSNPKSTKIGMMNQTVVPMGSESPETRFLMKEKLNDSMPVIKLQQKPGSKRRSVLDDLRGKIDAMDEESAEIEEINEKSPIKRMSVGKEDSALGHEPTSEKNKKKNRRKKNKKNLDDANESENLEETVTSFSESVRETEDGATDVSSTFAGKSKKLKKKIKTTALTPESEEITIETDEISEKKKKKKMKKTKQEEIIEIGETEETEINDNKKKMKKKKKKKSDNSKSEESLEISQSNATNDKENKKKKRKKDAESSITKDSEVPTSRSKSRRIAERNGGLVDSDDVPEAVDLAKARDAALRDLRRVAEIARTGQEAKKKTRKRNGDDGPTKLEITRTSVKRLPDDVIEALTDVTERPKKRRRIVGDDNFVPSASMFVQRAPKPKNLNVDDGFIPLSSVGGTTQFSVVNLKKVAKVTKKSVAASTFRERMLARNPRQPISAYLIYQQKQKASGQGRPY